MDKKLARENIKLGFHLSNDLNKGDFRHAKTDNYKIRHNLDIINKEITSGKARRER